VIPLLILCLNVQNGGGALARSRWSDILSFVDAHSPDITVFTEWRAGRSSVISWASARGMACAQATDGSTVNGVFVAAKRAFSTISTTPDRSSPGTLTLVRFADWSVLACYFPQGDKLAKDRYFDTCQRIASGCVDQPFLIVGDLNTGNQTLDRTPGGVPFFCAKRFDELSAGAGLIDLWRHSNGIKAQEWTWWSRGKSGSKNGFRIDHAFGNRKFVESFRPCCQYDHRPREEGISDHSALLISTSVRAGD
jgi:exodeoxyribonuclease III